MAIVARQDDPCREQSLRLQRRRPQLQLIDPVPQQGDLGFRADFPLRPALDAR
ncbi:hypothetical protein [Streptomyces sp. NPDC005476]|uniref:hypothetical protein n=1 Tax=Streptomyces sp. NPDC005476 TaxID=3156882 RepID=UPI00345349F3